VCVGLGFNTDECDSPWAEVIRTEGPAIIMEIDEVFGC
jgi:hypothetical protein